MMKTGAQIDRNITEQEALLRLEAAVRKLVKRAVWHSPFNVIPAARAKITQLRRPLVELDLARRRSMKAIV